MIYSLKKDIIVKITKILIVKYHFPIDLEPIGILFDAKSIIKIIFTIQIWFDLTIFRKDLSV